MEGLTGKTVIVTGGGSGIGRAIARRLGREGCHVGIFDLSQSGAEETAGLIREAGGQALVQVVDITNSARVNQAVAAFEAEASPVAVLVNNAGWDKVEPFIKSTEATWDKVLAINLKGPIICARAVLDGMIARRAGKIISIGSDAGRVGSTGEAVYSAAKGGIIAFSKTLAREVARYGINVNAVCPGPTNTPLFQGVTGDNPRLADALKAAIPLGRLGEPDDIAGVIAFLASDDARFITGQTLSVSGGLTMS
ncbi:MAG: SDR family NAD(P)-dependent oxidoreductase [Candidatus Binatia bacterium]